MKIFTLRIAATLWIASSAAVATAQVCAPVGPCGDINATDTVTVADALGVLQHSIGLNIDLQCSCDGGVTCDAAILTTTGQTMCWDRFDIDSPVDPVDCPGTGQDGDHQFGVAQTLQDNGNGTLSDTVTGLVWEKLSDDGSIHDYDNFSYQWAGAFDKVGTLNTANFAGYTDWRLPNARELGTLINLSAYNPAVSQPLNEECSAMCTVIECSCTRSSSYWTATTVQNTPTSAWAYNFQTGALSAQSKTGYQYVRAVRGGYKN